MRIWFPNYYYRGKRVVRSVSILCEKPLAKLPISKRNRIPEIWNSLALAHRPMVVLLLFCSLFFDRDAFPDLFFHATRRRMTARCLMMKKYSHSNALVVIPNRLRVCICFPYALKIWNNPLSFERLALLRNQFRVHRRRISTLSIDHQRQICTTKPHFVSFLKAKLPRFR